MTGLQKAIKYAAIAFAIFLIVSIASGILGAIGFFGGLIGDESVLGEMTTYTVSQNVTELTVDVNAADFVIKSGSVFSVESNLKNLSVKESDGELHITEKSKIHVTSSYSDAKLVIYIPEAWIFDCADITTGAGKVSIDVLSANKLSLELGAGEVNITELNAGNEAKIQSGAGAVKICNGVLNDLSCEIGAGKLELTAEILSKGKFECGVGSVNIILLGEKDSYRLKFDKGIGNVIVDGQSMSDNSVYGNGKNKIDFDCGIGNVKITFIEPIN